MNHRSFSPLFFALAASLTACGTYTGGESGGFAGGSTFLPVDSAIQAAIDKAVIGMPAGDFFSRYGPAYSRTEQLNLTTKYGWASSIGTTAPGVLSQDGRVCRLVVIADSRGRIASAVVTQDNTGRVSTSRCTEVFTGKENAQPSRPQPDA